MKSQRRHTNLVAGLLFIPYLFAATSVAQSLPAPRTVDLSAPDGTSLKATYFGAGKPGPAVLLLHQCNRQRKVWDTVKRGQEIALQTAKIGLPVGRLDDAVRGYYETQGWGPAYKLPGLPHRTGHGIGLDGHEAPYLVHSDNTPLQLGMCFSDEPGIYIPGEFGIRLEDCWHMTADGPRTFTALARSLEDPI